MGHQGAAGGVSSGGGRDIEARRGGVSRGGDNGNETWRGGRGTSRHGDIYITLEINDTKLFNKMFECWLIETFLPSWDAECIECLIWEKYLFHKKTLFLECFCRDSRK